MLDYLDAVNVKTDFAVKNIYGIVHYFTCEEAAKAYVFCAPYGTCWLV